MDLETTTNDTNDNHCNAADSEIIAKKEITCHESNSIPSEIHTKDDITENNSTNTSTDQNAEKVSFKIIYNKKKIDITYSLDATVADLKEHLQNIISVPSAMQKIMFKGLAKDDQTLRSIGITTGAKVMIVGSKLDDVLAVSIPTKQDITDEAAAASSKEPLSKQKLHRKILDKGIPEDVLPGILDIQEPLPDYPLTGMMNKKAGKVRLTFKLEQDQLWIGTKERTDKITMSSIKDVYSEPIHDHPQYHVMAIQLGPTEASRYWIYWVPAQYISAIKNTVLGKWCYFG